MTDAASDLREGTSEDDAPAMLQTLIPGRYEILQARDAGGWLIEVHDVNRYATDIIEDQDLFQDHFCEVELDPCDGDSSNIVECILTGRAPADGEPGILLECEYRRRVGGLTCSATVDGTIAIVPADLWDETLARMSREHGMRRMQSAILQAHYAAQALRSAMAAIDGPIDYSADLGNLRESAAILMRGSLIMEERHAAVAAS